MKRAILAVLLAATTLMAAGKDKKSTTMQNADAIYVNGSVYISAARYRPSSEEQDAGQLPQSEPAGAVAEASHRVQAFAVKDGKFLAVGNNEEIQKYKV
jgi:hypothetical protein